MNLVMWLIYHIELPFFERYKISSDPWPWAENKEEWNILLKKSIALVGFNNLVSTPITLFLFTTLQGRDVKM